MGSKLWDDQILKINKIGRNRFGVTEVSCQESGQIVHRTGTFSRKVLDRTERGNCIKMSIKRLKQQHAKDGKFGPIKAPGCNAALKNITTCFTVSSVLCRTFDRFTTCSSLFNLS